MWYSIRRLNRHSRIGAAVLSLVAGAAAHASAQAAPTATAPQDSEIASLRAEIAALRRDVEALRTALATVQPPVGQPQAPAVQPEQLEILRSQVAELAQTKVESVSKQPVRVFGAIVANTFFNSGDTNWIENPNLVAPPASTSASGSMSGTVRQSRVGLEMTGLAIGDWTATGTIIADFMGGTPGFATGPVMGLGRLMYAFGRLDRGGTAVEFGQNQVVFAPRDPTSLAAWGFPLLFRSGNLYQRVPQVRIEQRLGRLLRVAAAAGAPIAGDAGATFVFAPDAGAGERSRTPAYQARVVVGRDDPDASSEASLGLSMHAARRRVGSETVRAWGVALDGRLRSGGFAATGEWFTGENIEAFGGALSQPGRATGGWIQAQLDIARRTAVMAGVGVDRPVDAVGRLTRTENRTLFSGVTFSVTSETSLGLEYRHLQTMVGVVPVAYRNHHVNFVFALRY